MTMFTRWPNRPVLKPETDLNLGFISNIAKSILIHDAFEDLAKYRDVEIPGIISIKYGIRQALYY